VNLTGVLHSDVAWLIAAMLVDLFLGEPAAAIHPVVWMGRVTKQAERRVRNGGPIVQLVAGSFIALGVPCLFAGGSVLALRATTRWPLVTFVVGVWLLKSTAAFTALGAAGAKMRQHLPRGELDQARRSLGSLCSRDAADLDDQALIAGTIESLAENASDSIVAPLFYFALFGLPGAMFYRAVNTLDAMIGYRGRYEYLGKASARLDDLLNLAPARLTAFLLLIAGAATGQDARRGWRILWRDGGKTASPNAGRPMAVMAGLLGVALEKRGAYRLGDPTLSLAPATIDAAWRLVTVAASLAFVAATAMLVTHGHAF
jgi:adenosylcobinamide-phosphate synthase